MSVLLILALAMPVFVFAQEATTTPSNLQESLKELQAELVSLLKDRIKLLQAQVQDLVTKIQAVSGTEPKAVSKVVFEFTETLRQGSKGIEVERLQEFLKSIPGIYPEGLVTGYFGPLTEAAVKRFQEQNDIVSSGDPDSTGYGQVGPQTKEALNTDFAETDFIFIESEPFIATTELVVTPSEPTEEEIAVATTTSTTILLEDSTATTTTATTTDTSTNIATTTSSGGDGGGVSDGTTGTADTTTPDGGIGSGGDTSTSTPPEPADTTPPAISSIQTTNITDTSATITWTTDENADSNVNYATTPSASSPTSITDATLATSHSINLTGITADTIYYYTVVATDEAGNTTTSGEQSFTTLMPPPPPNSFSMDFNGSQQQYLSILGAKELNLDSSSLYWQFGTFALEAWIKLDPEASGKNTILSKVPKNLNNWAYSLSWDDGDLVVEMGELESAKTGGPQPGTGTYKEYRRPTMIPKGVWTHVAVSHRDSRFGFYINGVGVYTFERGPGGAVYLDTNGAEFDIGAEGSGTTGFFDGKIDEVRLWDSEILAGYIQDHYNKELTGNEDFLVGYWKFNNELVGDKVKDDSQNGNHLKLNNDPTFSTDTPF